MIRHSRPLVAALAAFFALAAVFAGFLLQGALAEDAYPSSQIAWAYGFTALIAIPILALTARSGRGPKLHSAALAFAITTAVALIGPFVAFFLLFGLGMGLGGLMAAIGLLTDPNSITASELLGLPLLFGMVAVAVAFFVFAAWAMLLALDLGKTSRAA